MRMKECTNDKRNNARIIYKEDRNCYHYIYWEQNKHWISKHEKNRLLLCWKIQKRIHVFIEKNNNVTTFEFGIKSNEPIRKAVDFIKNNTPLTLRECDLNEHEKDRSVYIVPVFGYKELGLSHDGFFIRQKESGEAYFNNDTRTFYILTEYKWDGPEFDSVTNRSDSQNSFSNTIEKSKGVTKGKGFGIGAVISPFGIAGGRSKQISRNHGSSVVAGNISSNSIERSGDVEKSTNATLSLKCVDDGKIYQLVFRCCREIDAIIKCFDFEYKQTKDDIIAYTSKSLEGIKALKELLDMGAITQEEFMKKKKELLG